MKKLILRDLIIVFSLMVYAVTNISSATNLNNLFEVAVPVMSQSSKERKVASKKAFEILLIRITGQRKLIGSAKGNQLVSRAKRYVSSFRYQHIVEETFDPPEEILIENEEIDSEEAAVDSESHSDAEVAEADSKPKATQQLVVSFDEKAVKSSLWKLKLPVWGKSRPSTLMWIAVQDETKRTLLDANENTLLLSYFRKHAEERGLPLLFPLLDLEDQININVTDVWGAFNDPIKNASSRYQPEAIISASLLLDPQGNWKTRWTLQQGSDEVSWQVTAASLETAVVNSLDDLADRLAQRYAHVSSVQEDVDIFINITDVNNLTDYVRVNKYLMALSTIKQAEISQVKGDELTYRLDLRSSTQALTQAIRLGKVLLKSEDPFASEVEVSNRLIYRLMP